MPNINKVGNKQTNKHCRDRDCELDAKIVTRKSRTKNNMRMERTNYTLSKTLSGISTI